VYWEFFSLNKLKILKRTRHLFKKS